MRPQYPAFEEIPETKSFAPDVDKIKSHACRAYSIKEDDLYVTKRGVFNEPGNVVIYLKRRLKNDTLRQVDGQFRIKKYSTFSSIIEKVKPMMKADRGLKKMMESLTERITMTQRPTPLLFRKTVNQDVVSSIDPLIAHGD